MKKILTPIDFSENSVNALEKAIHIAKKLDATITLVHVLPKKSVFSTFSTGKDRHTREEVEQNLETLITRLNKENGLEFNYIIREGAVYREVAAVSEEEEAFLLVMGTHGISGFEEFWMGSNAFRVVNHSPCPVITTRANVIKHEIDRIILPIDNSPETRQKVPFTAEIAAEFGSTVHVVTVFTDDAPEIIKKLTRYQQQVCDYFNEKGVQTQTDSLHGDNISSVTIEYAKQVDADLISIMTEQELDATNLILGAYAQQMVNHSPVPVLSIHPRSDIHVSVY